MSIVFAVALIAVNAVWAAVYWRREQTILEMSKLLASRTLAEYSWLKSAESGKVPAPPKQDPVDEASYEDIWERS